MDYGAFDGPDGIEFRIPTTDDYRTCAECGVDCCPDPSVGVDGLGARIAFVCPDHGVQSIVDPFADKR